MGELAKLVGVERLEINQATDAALTLIEKGNVEIIVVSLGPQGAVLVSKTETHHIPAPNIAKKSTVGAGDSMVGGMVWALSQNKSLKEVMQWGVACGSAAIMNEGNTIIQGRRSKTIIRMAAEKMSFATKTINGFDQPKT